MFKGRRFFSPRRLAIAPALLMVAAAGPSFADPPSLTDIWVVNPSDPFVQGNITQAAGPLNTTVSGSFVANPGAFSSGTQTNAVNYGTLFTSGSGSATAASNSSSSVNVGNFQDEALGADVAFSDVLTVTGSGPVTISLTDVFSGSISPGAGPAFSSDFISSNILNTELDSSGTASGTGIFNPGDQITVFDFVAAGCQIGLNPGGGSSSCSFQGSDQLYVDVMTAGGGYTAASGTQYLSAPATNGVPEPAAWMLMLLGFGGLGAALRSRRAAAAAA